MIYTLAQKSILALIALCTVNNETFQRGLTFLPLSDYYACPMTAEPQQGLNISVTALQPLPLGRCAVLRSLQTLIVYELLETGCIYLGHHKEKIYEKLKSLCNCVASDKENQENKTEL